MRTRDKLRAIAELEAIIRNPEPLLEAAKRLRDVDSAVYGPSIEEAPRGGSRRDRGQPLKGATPPRE